MSTAEFQPKPRTESGSSALMWVSVVFGSALVLIFFLALIAGSLDSRPTAAQYSATQTAVALLPTAAPTDPPATAVAVVAAPQAKTRKYKLKTVFGGQPVMHLEGVGGTINGQINPTLTAEVGDTVEITLVNGDGQLHDLTVPDYGVTTGEFAGKDQEKIISFEATQPGEFKYICKVPGHEQTGMVGKLRVTGEVKAGDKPAANTSGGNAPVVPAAPPPDPAKPDAVSVVRNPTDMPGPIERREPITLKVDMATVEVTGQLADGTTYNYFTFDGKIPGPMLRVRVGDTVEFTLKNDEKSLFPHSIDLHAVTGPGGGAVYTQTTPGGATTFTFKAINSGVYVYHCATPSIPHHISNGMYGLIVVEPENGLPKVDREFYVMQGEIYTQHDFGTAGHMNFDAGKMSHEQPEYFIFNGAAGGLTTDDNALRAKVGETVRIYFGVGGPNFTSSFHVIGEIFDRVYELASLTGQPLTDVQTVLVPTGGAVMVEFKVDVPGRYILVDHSLSRLERGLAGFLYVEGEAQPDIFKGEGTGEAAGH